MKAAEQPTGAIFPPQPAPCLFGIPPKINGDTSNKISHPPAHSTFSVKNFNARVFPYLYLLPTGVCVLFDVLFTVSLLSVVWRSSMYIYGHATARKTHRTFKTFNC